jgi:hypothetical protein
MHTLLGLKLLSSSTNILSRDLNLAEKKREEKDASIVADLKRQFDPPKAASSKGGRLS